MFSDHHEIKPEINNNRKTIRKPPNTWKLNNTLLNNGSKRKSQGKFIALNAYIRKDEKSQTDKFLSQELPQKSKISPKQTQERK